MQRPWAMVAASAFVAAQLLVPAAEWDKPHELFQWRMFSKVSTWEPVTILYRDGDRKPMDMDLIVQRRAEVPPHAWAQAACEIDAEAVAVEVGEDTFQC